MKKFHLLVCAVALFVGLMLPSSVVAAVMANVYTPTVTEDEVTVFLETSSSNAKVWAWNGETNCCTNGVWPGDDMTLAGQTASGKNIFKWTCSKSTAPANIIFTHDGGTKWVDKDMEYVNHGYYVDGVYSKTIEAGSGKVMVYFSNEAVSSSEFYCYIYNGTTAAEPWPGIKMTWDANAKFNGQTGWYTVEVPSAFITGYFVVNNGSEGSQLAGKTVYVSGVATEIETVEASAVQKEADDNWYSITGLRVSKPTQAGIYIHNGKKVIIRK